MYPNPHLDQIAQQHIADRIRDADARRTARAALRASSTENAASIPRPHRVRRAWFSRPAFT